MKTRSASSAQLSSTPEATNVASDNGLHAIVLQGSSKDQVSKDWFILLIPSSVEELYPLASVNELTCIALKEVENAVTMRREEREFWDGNNWVEAKAMVASDLLPLRDVA